MINWIRPGLRKIAENTAWLSFERVARMIVGLFVGTWLARYLGPEQYGVYNYALSIVMLFGSFTSLGLYGIIVHEIVCAPAKKNEILGTTFILKLATCILVIAIIILAISLLNSYEKDTLLIVTVFAFSLLFRPFENIDLWFQSQVSSKYAVYAKSSAFFLTTFLKISILLIEGDLVAFAFLFVLELLISAIALVIAYKINKQSLRAWSFSFSTGRRLLSKSWPLLFSSIGVTIYLKIDQIMLGEMLPLEEVGIYSAAVRLSELWYFLPGFIAVSVFPAMIKSQELGRDIYNERLQRLYDFMIWIGILISLSVSIFSSHIVSSFYGESYQASSRILAIHIWACAFIFGGHILSKWIINEGVFKFSLVRHGLGALVNLMLNWFLIPKYGGLGAAIATVVSYASASYLACFFYPRTWSMARMITLAFLAPLRVALKHGQ